MTIPSVNLTAGQAILTLWQPSFMIGEIPTARFKAALLALRRLGVPFAPEEETKGAGFPLTYTFDHLAEAAVALELINRGARPGDVATYIVRWRSELRQMFVEAYDNREMHEGWRHYPLPDPNASTSEPEDKELDAEDVLIGQGMFLDVVIAFNRSEHGAKLVAPPELLTPTEAAKRLFNIESSRYTSVMIALSGLLDTTVRNALYIPTRPRGRPRRSPT